jgi:hypothetical protein
MPVCIITFSHLARSCTSSCVPSTRGLADQDPDTQGSISLGPVNRSSNEGDTAGAAVPDFPGGPATPVHWLPVPSLTLSVIVRAASRYLRIGSLPCELFIQAVLKTLIPKFPGRVEAAGIDSESERLMMFRSMQPKPAVRVTVAGTVKWLPVQAPSWSSRLSVIAACSSSGSSIVCIVDAA